MEKGSKNWSESKKRKLEALPRTATKVSVGYILHELVCRCHLSKIPFEAKQRLTLTPPTRVERNNVCKQCRNETITRRFFDVSSCCCSFLFFFYLLTNPSCRNMAPPCLLFRYLSPIGESFCRTFCVNV